MIRRRYVVGFMFSPEFRSVVLIRKQRPIWQCGLFNGVGGHIEAGEFPIAAMVREFREETGVATFEDDWSLFATMDGINDDGDGFDLFCFATRAWNSAVRSASDEVVSVVKVDNIQNLRREMVANLQWLIPLAIDHLADGRPACVRIAYGRMVLASRP